MSIWINTAKNAATWVYEYIKEFLLQEDGYFLLLEDGGKIIIDGKGDASWGYQTKN